MMPPEVGSRAHSAALELPIPDQSVLVELKDRRS